MEWLGFLYALALGLSYLIGVWTEAKRRKRVTVIKCSKTEVGELLDCFDSCMEKIIAKRLGRETA